MAPLPGPPPPATLPTAVEANAPSAAAPGRPAGAPGAAAAPAEPAEGTAAAPRRNGFFVYRRIGEAPYGEPLGGEPLERRNAVDADVPYGARACYVVRAVASTDPLIESAPSNEACVERRDTTAPAAPAGLAILPRSDGLEVLWSPSSEADLAGYRVYREGPGQARQRLVELSPEKAGYLDTAPAKGTAYRYVVTAFDQSGNESEPSEPAEGSLP